MNKEEFNNFAEMSEKIFKRIYDADMVAGKFAEKADLENHLQSVRELSEKLENLLNTDSAKGSFNLLIGFVYQPLEKLPGIARYCNEQKRYFFKRAKEYGIKFPKQEKLPELKREQLP